MITSPLKVNENTEMRQLIPQDIDIHYNLFELNRAHIGQWETWAHTTTKDHQQQFLETCQKRYENHTGFACGIWYQSTYVGIITALMDDVGTIELSYWLAKKHTGKGIMTRCLRTLIQNLANDERISKARLIISKHNTPSRKLAERLNFNLHLTMNNQRVVYLLAL